MGIEFLNVVAAVPMTAEGEKVSIKPIKEEIEDARRKTAKHIYGRILRMLNVPVLGKKAKEKIAEFLQSFEEDLVAKKLWPVMGKHTEVLMRQVWEIVKNDRLSKIDFPEVVEPIGEAKDLSAEEWTKVVKLIKFSFERLRDMPAYQKAIFYKFKGKFKNKLVTPLTDDDAGWIGKDLWGERYRMLNINEVRWCAELQKILLAQSR